MLSSESLGTGNSQWVVVDYNRPGKEMGGRFPKKMVLSIGGA